MRKTIEITMEDNGETLTFVIEQMPATRLQKFILRALPLLASVGSAGEQAGLGALQENIEGGDFSFLTGLDPLKTEPLVEELYSCVKRKVGNGFVQVTSINVDGMITDVRSLFKLQGEVIKLNFSFLSQGEASNTLATEAKTANTFNMRT